MLSRVETYEKSFDVLSSRASNVEEDEGKVGDEEDVASSPLFRERSPSGNESRRSERESGGQKDAERTVEVRKRIPTLRDT